MPQGKLLTECFAQPSVLSIAQCIQSDFLLKSQTNFYIPQEAYGGYSYLNEAEEEPQRHNYHKAHLFVAAEPTVGLHPHQWHPHLEPVSHNNFTRPIVFPQHRAVIKHPMTIPYIHPETQLPVPPLLLPTYFGALCFSFTIGGIFMLYTAPRWVRRGHWFPYRGFAWALILFQGPCSFLADYVHMTNNSPWHLIDRFLACILMSFEIVKLITMRPYTRPAVYALYLISTAIAMGCFMKSQESQKLLDRDGFIFWHCGWHCYPFLGVAVVGLEKWIISQYGEYYSFENAKDCKYERGEGSGMLLSTIVMEYIYGKESCGGKHPKWNVMKGDGRKRLDL